MNMNAIKEHRFALVFFVIILVFFLGSSGNRWYSGNWMEPASITIVNVLLFGVMFGVAKSRIEKGLLGFAFAGLLILIALLHATSIDIPHYVPNALTLMFLSMCCWIVLRFLAGQSQVSSDTLFGALCGYAIIIMVFAAIYVLLDSVHPGSFHIAQGLQAANDHISIAESSNALYFSVVTITTLGYGDISPVSQAARLFPSFEAFVGQLYLAILIARLVGLHLLGSGNSVN